MSKIGVFDSGVGGLIILRSIKVLLPHYDYVYYGDTLNLPYGDKTQEQIFQLTVDGINYLKDKGCSLVVIACNTASAKALRKIQQEWLKQQSREMKILGVIVPTIEELSSSTHGVASIGIIATQSTIESGAYEREIHKILPHAVVHSVATPALVPLIERSDLTAAANEIARYLNPLKNRIDSLVLGCTHYPLLRKEAQKILGPGVKIISQDSIIPRKLHNYLQKHPEVNTPLSKTGSTQLFVTQLTPHISKLSQSWFDNTPLEEIKKTT